jgi:hypothetical protein
MIDSSAASTTIFVATVGDAENFRDCMDHLQAQSVQRPIEVVDHVAPMSAAFQQMLDRCTTRFYVQVDEDMILFPDAIATLERLIEERPENVAMVGAGLWDCDTQCSIYGVKIYRHAIVREFPCRDVAECEVDQIARMTAAGFIADGLPLGDRSSCLGEHGKHYTPATIFKRWQRVFQTHRRLNNMKWIEPWAQGLLDRYIETRDIFHLYALGAIAGITGEPFADRELDWREPNAAPARVEKCFPLKK